jgi:hypothetical protein
MVTPFYYLKSFIKILIEMRDFDQSSSYSYSFLESFLKHHREPAPFFFQLSHRMFRNICCHEKFKRRMNKKKKKKMIL